MENEEIKPTSTIKNIYNFIIKTSSLMAIGLFATLIIGTIINQIGVLTTFTPLAEIGTVVQAFMGIGIGLAIATYDKENSSPIRIVSMGVAGGIASAINPISILTENLVDIMILVGFSILVWAFAATKRKITRKEGIAMAGLYLVYAVYIILR